VDCHNARVMTLKALGRTEEALLGAEKTLVLDPENAKAFYLKGTLLIKEKDFPAADRAIRASLRLRPTNAAAEKDLDLIDEKLDEMLDEYLSDDKTVKILGYLGFASLLTCFFTRNAASIAAGLGLLILSRYRVNVLKCRPGSRKRSAMLRFAPLQVLLGILAVVFFYDAQPWNTDRTAWFFAMVFCGVLIYVEDVFNEERGILFEYLTNIIGGCAFIIGLFSLSLPWVITSFNCFYLFSILEEFRTYRSNLSWRNLGFSSIWILILLFIDSNLLREGELNKVWYGNGDLWIGEFIYMLLCVYFRNSLIEIEQKEEEPGHNHKLVPLGGSHE
jgi:tetratricopeptide (TPR) repeat protein